MQSIRRLQGQPLPKPTSSCSACLNYFYNPMESNQEIVDISQIQRLMEVQLGGTRKGHSWPRRKRYGIYNGKAPWMGAMGYDLVFQTPYPQVPNPRWTGLSPTDAKREWWKPPIAKPALQDQQWTMEKLQRSKYYHITQGEMERWPSKRSSPEWNKKIHWRHKYKNVMNEHKKWAEQTAALQLSRLKRQAWKDNFNDYMSQRYVEDIVLNQAHCLQNKIAPQQIVLLSGAIKKYRDQVENASLPGKSVPTGSYVPTNEDLLISPGYD